MDHVFESLQIRACVQRVNVAVIKKHRMSPTVSYVRIKSFFIDEHINFPHSLSPLKVATIYFE